MAGPFSRMLRPRSKSAANNKGSFGFCLKMIQQHRGFIRFALDEEPAIDGNRHGEPAHVILVHCVAQLRIDIAVVIQKLRARPHHEQLPNFLFGGELAQSLLRPLLPIAVKMNGPGLLKAILRERRSSDQEDEE